VVKLVLLGGGGHASDVLGLIEDVNAHGDAPTIEIVGLVSKDVPEENRFKHRRIPRLESLEVALRLGATHGLVAVGDSRERSRVVYEELFGLGSPSLVHPQAAAGTGCTFGNGTVILGGSRFSPNVSVGEHVYISHGVLVGHDAIIEDFATLLPGAIVSGGVTVKIGATIGSGAVILPNLVIGTGAQVGAGAVVLSNVRENRTVVGVPAKETGSSQQIWSSNYK